MNKKEKIDYKYNFGLYWVFLKKYKLLAFILIIIVLLLEIFTVLERYLFKVLVDKGTNFTTKTLAIDQFKLILLYIALVFLGLVLAKTLFSWLRIHFLNLLEANLILDLKRKFFNHIIHLSYEFHTTHRTGSLISRLTRGGNSMERMTDVFIFNVFPLIFQLGVAIISFIYFDLIPALVVFIVTIFFIIFNLFMTKLQSKAHIRANNAEDFEKANISDILINIESIKYFGKESLIKRKFENITENSRKTILTLWNYFRWFEVGQTIIVGFGVLFLMYFPISQFLKEEITLGTLVFIYTVYGTVVGTIYGFVHGIRNFQKAMADFESLFKYNQIENEVKDLVHSTPLEIKHGDIEFKNVSFAYKKRKIFSNFNLIVHTNNKIALVGPSGSGKSTLIKLLYRFYDINEGEILIDGKNINKFKQESLRSELSIVPQECVLFDDTIYNNIAFSKPGATKNEVLKAIGFAQLDKVIAKFSNKENTIVGERGVKLSGGEKQRVSIARAILANKKILVLDEATSSLDSETEHEIQSDLEHLMMGRTSIIIAHRLSTIMKADMIVVLNNGNVEQIGTHRQLIIQKGLYKKLWHLQKGGYIK